MATLLFASRHVRLAFASLAIIAMCGAWLASHLNAAHKSAPASQGQTAPRDTPPSAFVASGGLVPDEVDQDH